MLNLALSLSPTTPPADPDPVGVWPLSPRPVAVAPFAPPDSTFGTGHRGVDLLGRPGAWVRAALPGRVSFVGRIAGRGVVVVDHGKTRTTYEPVGGLHPLGAAVAAGDPIGVLDRAGSHCFPEACLHWGWIEGTTYLDPLRLVGDTGPVRLLPWGSGPGMGLLVGPPEPVGRDVGVDLGGRQRGVAQ